ncbi:MAG: phage tail sheath subtilisin-like domain-containing protein, partial [Nitrososphaerota archaeon]
EVTTTSQLGFPDIGVYFAGGGSDGTLNLGQNHWLLALDKLFKSEEQFDILCLPGIWDPTIALTMLTKVSELERKDFFIVLDAPSILSLSEVIDFKHGNLAGFNTQVTLTSEFASLTYPWTKESVGVFSNVKLVPASISKVVSMIKTDNQVGPWGAAAGKTRGLLNIIDTAVKVSLNDANSLITFPNNINPIVFFPDTGFVIWGQKTLASDVSTLVTRENVVRNKVFLIKQIKKILEGFLFETITDTLLTFVNHAVTDFLLIQQGKGGIISFQVISDRSVNPPELIADNQFQVFVKVQPVTVAEIITLQFIVTSNIGVTLA